MEKTAIVKPDTATRWYIWYTKPRAEKKVLERLTSRGVRAFLPLHKELRKWSDRKKWVETPLFNGYIFTSIGLSGWEKVQYTEGILNYVRFDGKPAYLSDKDIENIRAFISGDPSGLTIEASPIAPGELVEIVAGPLQGMHGEMVDYRGSKKLALRIEQLGKVLLVEIARDCVKRNRRA